LKYLQIPIQGLLFIFYYSSSREKKGKKITLDPDQNADPDPGTSKIRIQIQNPGIAVTFFSKFKSNFCTNAEQDIASD